MCGCEADDAGGSGVRRRIVVHVGQLDGHGMVFALSAVDARRALEESGLPGAADRSRVTIVEEEADVVPVPVSVRTDAESGTLLRWTCPVCGADWQDEWSDADRLPVLLLCDCGGTRNTWCLGEAVDAAG